MDNLTYQQLMGCAFRSLLLGHLATDIYDLKIILEGMETYFLYVAQQEKMEYENFGNFDQSIQLFLTHLESLKSVKEVQEIHNKRQSPLPELDKDVIIQEVEDSLNENQSD